MKNIVWQLILALGAGMIVTGLCFDLIGIGIGAGYVTRQQDQTRRQLKELKSSVEEYRLKQGRWATSIADLNLGWSDAPRQDRYIFDAWSRRIIYEKHNLTYRLVSYGADGKPGGVSLNCDLTSDNLNPPEAQLSWLEILRAPLLDGVIVMSLICGALVATMTFSSLRNREFKREKWLVLAVHLIVLIAASALTSLFITMFDIPTGH